MHLWGARDKKCLQRSLRVPLTDEEVIEDIGESLKDVRFGGNINVGFIAEPSNLSFQKPNTQRYSPSLLAIASLLHGISPACCKQVYNDGLLALSSPSHLRPLCSVIDNDLRTLTESANAYLTARYKTLSDREHLVSILMDKVCSHQYVKFINDISLVHKMDSSQKRCCVECWNQSLGSTEM